MRPGVALVLRQLEAALDILYEAEALTRPPACRPRRDGRALLAVAALAGGGR